MIEPKLENVRFPETNLEKLLIPCSKCLGVTVGEELTAKLRGMDENDFDYAIVFESGDSKVGVQGLISRQYLRGLMEKNRTLMAGDNNITPVESAEIDIRVCLGSLLRQLAERPALFVTHEAEAEEFGSVNMFYGLITRSDLNKPPVRTLIYEVLAKLELALSDIILASACDHYGWIRRLAEDSQARILGYWELSKLQNVNVGPMAGATLADLLNVIAKDGELRSNLGYGSRNSFEDAVGHLPRIRNQIMHPIRPLISDKASCTSLERTIRTALVLTRRAEQYHVHPESKK